MDQEQNLPLKNLEAPHAKTVAQAPRPSRRRVLKYGASGLACLSVGGAAAYYFRRLRESAAAAAVFKNDAPQGKLWELWKKRGWVKEAQHYVRLGKNIQCGLCPNECVLEPEDRGRCRNRVHKEGKLYTMAYGNFCAQHFDPIEKKPLFHFLPRTDVYSFATSGCGFRCLNCQNWDISQRKPEETKDPRGEPIRLIPRRVHLARGPDSVRMSMFPEDVVAIAQFYGCPSIAYTYSEPAVWFEYMFDTAKAAREKDIKNVWVTCGYIQQEPLLELCEVIDAANVDLKSFDEEIYQTLNTGKLEPILATLKTLKRQGVWFEVTNLIVPTYTDKPAMIRQMCDWLVLNLGPDYPLHFSRFSPHHKLTHLPPTPIENLEEAREIARDAGLHYVYVGNCPEVEHAETTFCPNPKCKKPIVERYIYNVRTVNLNHGSCANCGQEIRGVWSA